MYSKSGIKDYITLFLSEADVTTGGRYTWNVPIAYYTNQRSTVCTVSIVGGSVHTTYTERGMLVDYKNGGLNSYNKRQRHIIGHGQMSDDTNNVYYIRGGIDLLVAARPDKITLALINEVDRLEHVASSGALTLQFCYYNASDVSSDLHSQFTPTLK